MEKSVALRRVLPRNVTSCRTLERMRRHITRAQQSRAAMIGGLFIGGVGSALLAWALR